MRLTVGQRRVLEFLASDIEADLVQEDGVGWWVGLKRTNGRLAQSLLKTALVSTESHSNDRVRYYTINECGRRALAGEKPYCDSNGKWFDNLEDLICANGGTA